DRATETERATAHHADDRDLGAPERTVAIEDRVACVAAVKRIGHRRCAAARRAQPADAEILTRATQHQYARTLRCTVNNAGKLGRHIVRHAVAALWMIDGNLEHAALLFVQKVAHE